MISRSQALLIDSIYSSMILQNCHDAHDKGNKEIQHGSILHDLDFSTSMQPDLEQRE